MEWNTSPFVVSKSQIQGFGVFFQPSEKEAGKIAEDSLLFPYGGEIHLRSDPIGNFHFSKSIFV